MRKHNLAFVDIETTGFDLEKHEIIELAVVLVRQLGTEGKDFEVIEELEFKIKPEHIGSADPQSLKVNGYDEGAWIFASSLADVMKVFAEKTENAIFVAHNLTFDFSFIEKAFQKTGVENKMFYPKLDTISMAYAKLHKNLSVEKFRLQKLCEHFGIENPKAHTALSDTRTLFEVYKRLMSL